MLDRHGDQLREILRQPLLAIANTGWSAVRPKLSAPMIRPRAEIGTMSTGPATSSSSALRAASARSSSRCVAGRERTTCSSRSARR